MALEFRDPIDTSGNPGDGGTSGAGEKASAGHSKSKALVLSVLVPGAGQYYAGKKERATAFFIAEAAIWTSFIVFEVQGHLRQNNYVEYAELLAGVDAEGKSDEFYRSLGQYMRSDPGPGSYNEDVRREARALYPDDVQKQQEYLQENGYFGDDAWEWQTEEDLAQYRSLRRKSQLSFRRATYMLGVAVASRIVAAMDAARTSARSNAPPKPSPSIGLEMKTNPGQSPGMLLCLRKSF